MLVIGINTHEDVVIDTPAGKIYLSFTPRRRGGIACAFECPREFMIERYPTRFPRDEQGRILRTDRSGGTPPGPNNGVAP